MSGGSKMPAKGTANRTRRENQRPSAARGWRLALTYLAWIVLLFAISVVPYIFFDGDFARVVEETMTEDATRTAVAAIGVALLVADLSLVIPSGLIIALMAALLGGIPGAIAGVAGLSLACVLGFWIGRNISKDFSDNPTEQSQFRYAKDLIRRNGVIILAACRPIPVLIGLGRAWSYRPIDRLMSR